MCAKIWYTDMHMFNVRQGLLTYITTASTTCTIVAVVVTVVAVVDAE